MEHAEDRDQITEYLPVGTRLLNGTYEITDHLGAGGFGLTYLADDQIGRKVVIKECFPASFCVRDGFKVRAQTNAQQENFEKLIKNFVNEARQLAKLKHPNVVPVLHFFEENDTAYMSLEYIKGDDLAMRVHAHGADMEADRIIEIAVGILRALDYIHARGLLHRDIAPDNVIINEADQPVLIDFGASRNETAQAVTRLLSQQLRAVKDGYSPQEFYMPGRQHTPASDIYSLGATIYTLITGTVPQDAYTRLVELSKKEPDPLVPLTGSVEGFPEAFLTAIDKALSLLPKDRPQSAEELRALMAPNSANVMPLNRKAAEARGAGDGPVAPKRPTREPKPHVSRPPAIDTSAPRLDTSQPRFDPNKPTRVVKPRVLTRSSEQPRAGTVPVQPPATPPRTSPPPTMDPGAPQSAPPVQRAVPQSEPAMAEAEMPPTRPQMEALPPQKAKVSTIDKFLRGAALAVIAGGAFVYLGGQTTIITTAAERVQSGVVSLAAGPVVVTSDPTAVFDVAPAPSAPTPVAVAAAANEPTITPAAAQEADAVVAMPDPVGVQTGWAANGWAVTLDLPLVYDGADIVFAEGGASPYPPGTILTRVAGVEAGANPAAIATLAAEYFSAVDPDGPRLPVAVRNPAFDSLGTAELRVDVSRVVDFGAFTLTQRPEGEGWAVRVATATPESGLRDGDILVSEGQSQTAITRIAELEAILEAHRADDTEETVFRVERSGASQEISLNTADIQPTGGAG